ncbi:MAG: hypothetical protein U1F42_05495 [Candidatus Competibacteraceae bacterium]
MIKELLERVCGNEFDRILGKAASAAQILVYWNRGLGDIALGLYELFERIREVQPAAAITCPRYRRARTSPMRSGCSTYRA